MPPVFRNFIDGGENFGSDRVDPVDVEVKLFLGDKGSHSVDDKRSADQDGAGCKMIEVSFRDGVVFDGAHEGSRGGAHPGRFSGLRFCFHWKHTLSAFSVEGLPGQPDDVVMGVWRRWGDPRGL